MTADWCATARVVSRCLEVEDGLPPGRIHGLYLDQSQRLWIASGSDGLARIDDTSAERPAFVRLRPPMVYQPTCCSV